MTKRNAATAETVAVDTELFTNSNAAALASVEAGHGLPDSQPKARKARKANEQTACACGCGLIGHGTWRPGHDARAKSRLLAEARNGNADARRELIERGWATDDSIDNASGKRTDAERAERQRLRIAAKLDQARAAVADLEAQLDSLNDDSGEPLNTVPGDVAARDSL